MNIIDTRSNISLSKLKKGAARNVPLFEIKEVEYVIPPLVFTDIIFQSIPSVEFFKHKELLKDKNVYSMGPSTKSFLSQHGVDSICPDIPGSKELNKLLIKNNIESNYLIVKGEHGLSDVFNYLKENKKNVEEIICYKRTKLKNYDDIKIFFLDADAIIFSSTYGVKIFFDEIYSDDIKAKLFGISDRIISYISHCGYRAELLNYFSSDIAKSIKSSI